MKEIFEYPEIDKFPQAFETTFVTNTKEVQSIIANESGQR